MKSKFIMYATLLTVMAFTPSVVAQKNKKMEAAQTDPLRDFELIVNHCVAWNKQFEADRVAFNERTKKWGKQVNSPAKISYDVKRTDSLVSPFSAIMSIQNVAFVENAETEDEIKVKSIAPDTSNAMASTFNLNFAMQNGKWVTTGGTSSRTLRINGKWERADKISLELDLTSPTRPTEIRGCTP
ncbi:MAG: hypothetical protein M0P52_15865 [Rhodoferax sp.]|nr:hypothetical protein [Rhodoferax sp.]